MRRDIPERPSRRAFTIIELLVVITIIALLMALLIPAVQQARAAARATQCRNQVRQIAVALHNYHEARGGFPIGHVPDLFWTWQSMTLPYLEQNALYKRLQFDYKDWPNDCFAANLSLGADDPGGVVVPVFQCPSDPNSGRIYTSEPIYGKHMPGNYLGVSGTDVGSNDGIFYLSSFTRLRDVSDGASNTLMIGERGIPRDLIQGWLLCAAGTPVGSGNHDSHLSMAVGLRPGTDDSTHNNHFWSHHTGGAHFALADGSIRFLSENANHDTLRRLSTRAAGDVPGEF